MPDKNINLRIVACKNLSDSFVRYANKALQHADNRSLRELGAIDFSEKSLFTVETIIRIIRLDEESEQALAIFKSFDSFKTGNRDDLIIRICRSSGFYVFEVACRNLPLSWQAKKSFWQGEQLGIETENGKLFFNIDEKGGGMATEKYIQIKAQVLGISTDKVQFSIQPKII